MRICNSRFCIQSITLVQLFPRSWYAWLTRRVTGRIDRDEFTQICRRLSNLQVEKNENDIQKLIRNENLRGGLETRREREWLAKQSVSLPSSTFEIHKSTLPTGEVQYLNSTTGFLSTDKPLEDARTFSSMAFTAAMIIVPRLSLTLEALVLENAPMEHQKSCEQVLQAASVFTLLEGEEGPAKRSDLDMLLAVRQQGLIRDEDTTSSLGQPYTDLEHVQQLNYELLSNIQGFVSSLRSPTLHDIERSDPFIHFERPTLDYWRSLQIPRRTCDIESQAVACRNFGGLIRNLRKWTGSVSKAEDAKERLSLEEVREVQRNGFKSKVRLQISTITGLKKRNFFRTSFPKHLRYYHTRQPLIVARIYEYYDLGRHHYWGSEKICRQK